MLLAAIGGLSTATACAGPATLTWNPPTQNTDGSSLTDLAGYRVFWRCGSGAGYPNSLTIPSVSSYVLSGLPDVGTCYFALAARNEAGVESALSNEASKTFAGISPDDPTTGPTITWGQSVAIARDASSPADFYIVTPGGTDDPTGTSASFTPPVDSIITVSIACDTAAGTTPTATVSNTGFSISPAWSSALQESRGDSEGTAGVVYIFRSLVTASAAGTLTVSVANIGTSTSGNAGRVYVDVWTGADADQSTAVNNEGSFVTNTFTSTVLTTGRDGSQVVVIYGDWNALGTPTTGQSGTGFDISGRYSGIRTYQTTPTTAGAVAGAFDGAGSSNSDTNWVSLEVLAAEGGEPDPSILPLVARGLSGMGDMGMIR